MVLYNGLVFTDECRFARLDVEYSEGKIVRLAPAGSLPIEGGYDAAGGFVLPGLVDIHSHGCLGGDFSDGEAASIESMLEFYALRGITSVVPATMSLDQPKLRAIIEAMRPYFGKEGYGAVLRGVNMEGPFLSLEKRGAQNPDYITPPSLSQFDELYELSGGNIRLVDIAPELPESPAFIAGVCRRCVVSLAHTTATYSQAEAAFKAGASHVTHLFNAMPPFNHREPGLIGAASDYASYVELISDGIHLHPSVVRSVFRWFGENRVCLISDSIRATGMPEGEYTLGGQAVMMKDGRATLIDGTLAGSAATLADCCRRAVSFGVPIEQALRASTINPAQAVGLANEVGSLTPGKRADILVWNPELRPLLVVAGGRTVFE